MWNIYSREQNIVNKSEVDMNYQSGETLAVYPLSSK